MMKGKTNVTWEKTIKVKEKFIKFIDEKGTPVKIGNFIDENNSFLKELYSSMDSVTNLFRTLKKEGFIEVIQWPNKPTSMILTNQYLIYKGYTKPTNERDWLFEEEKQKLREKFSKKNITGTNNSFKREAITFIGSFKTKEENAKFMANLFSAIYNEHKRPMKTEEVTKIILGNDYDEETYNVVLENFRQAKGSHFFQRVVLKNETKDTGYMVPTNIKKVGIEHRDWLYLDEWRQEYKKEWSERDVEAESNKEKSVFEELLNEKRYGIYLFVKINVLSQTPKDYITEIKVNDYLPQERKLLIRSKFDNGYIEKVGVELSKETNELFKRWIKERATYKTSSSPYLFITNRSEKIENPITYMNNFRKVAKEHDFELNLHYRDFGGRTNLSKQKVEYAMMECINTNLEIAALGRRKEWFADIEREHLSLVSKGEI